MTRLLRSKLCVELSQPGALINTLHLNHLLNYLPSPIPLSSFLALAGLCTVYPFKGQSKGIFQQSNQVVWDGVIITDEGQAMKVLERQWQKEKEERRIVDNPEEMKILRRRWKDPHFPGRVEGNKGIKIKELSYLLNLLKTLQSDKMDISELKQAMLTTSAGEKGMVFDYYSKEALEREGQVEEVKEEKEDNTKPKELATEMEKEKKKREFVAVNSFMHLFDANTGKQNGEYDMGNIVTALVIEDRQRKLHFGTIDGEKRHSDTIASLEYIPLSHPILRARLIRAHLEADSSDALHSVGWRTHCQRATFTTITHLAPLEHLLPINLVPTKDNATQQPDQKHH
ncbi:hypothetical protein BLNAU_2544 [Blattamonas nauphoetae]|uniref:Uncharacterized protein n=1 Tax=Blattamonas nauphoetae TaxID=2049346 RepID=A0ABQ9YFA0_9EUKA|nr:hypothetical protein BLNAU_2544 [Blattamonas nauphoetae]